MNKNLLYLVKFFLLCILLITGSMINYVHGQTILTRGDIAIIGIRGNSPDYLKLMTMVDLTCGTTFIITDNQWNNSSDSWPCNAGDSEYGATLTVRSKVCAGSVILIEDDGDNGFTVSSSTGALSIADIGGAWGSNSGFNNGGDNAFVLQGARTSPTFIYGLKNNGNWANGDCDEVDDTALPDLLTNGTDAIFFGSGAGARHYNCTAGTSGTKTSLLSLISNSSNWTTSSITWTTASCAFTVTNACTPPTHKAVSFSSSGITQTTATISWSNCPSPGTNPGNTKVLVVARAGAAISTDPTSGSTYTANAAFGSGTAIGAGFVVYDGIGTSVNLTGLTAGTTYHFSIYEYSCTGNCYNTDDLPGSITTSAPLLVELLYFHATQKNNLLEFEWLTISEKDNDHFEIEGSNDGVHFKTLGNVKGKGNSQEVQLYSYSSFNNESFHYFRLKEVDINNQVQYSAIEQISDTQTEIEIFPIPVSDELFVRLKNSEKTTLTILDLSGKELYTAVDLSCDVHTLDLRSLHSGTYLLFIHTIGQNTCKRFYKW